MASQSPINYSSINGISFPNIYDEVMSSGLLASGSAFEITDTTFDTKLAYCRYSVGQRVYVLSLSKQSYIPLSVKGVYLHGSQIVYDVGLQIAVPEQFVLGQLEYTLFIGKNIPVPVLQTKRKTSKLHDIPYYLTAVGALP